MAEVAEGRQPGRAIPVSSGVTLVFGTAVVTWWATGLRSEGFPGHAVGPYSVPLPIEYAVGAVAVLGMVWASVVVPRIRKPYRHRVSRAATFWVSCVAVLAAASWREVTHGVAGADMGPGIVLIVSPFLVSALIVKAVRAERESRVRPLPRAKLQIGCALLLAPVLLALDYALL